MRQPISFMATTHFANRLLIEEKPIRNGKHYVSLIAPKRFSNDQKFDLPKSKWKMAWDVLTGKADALYWLH